ncbi:MAG TPA: SOS response-associated peptidase [Lacipirellulaceae bacterium]|nr:SOS response-associated peptidase [Lacipirellulaceae bacterium]
MCGRFTLRTPAPVLIGQFDVEVSADRQLALFAPRYNIAPTQEIVVVRADSGSGRRTASTMRWGLIPSWSKEGTKGRPMINARAETVAEKPAFRTAYRCRRCLIPADGFYEWQEPASGRGKKQPYYIHRSDDRPFAFAGLWESWRCGPAPMIAKAEPSPNPSLEGRGGEAPLTIESCTIVTTAATGAMRELHDRMPVILAPGDYSQWLDPTLREPSALAHMLEPGEEVELVAEPVSTRVNRVTEVEDPDCILPLFDR